MLEIASQSKRPLDLFGSDLTVQYKPTIDQIREASKRIEAITHRTAVMTARSIDHICQCKVFFKCENLQKVGAFKARGAANAVFSLSDREASMGVATHSSGNHAAALAYAAGCRGIKAFVVMPDNASPVKKAAVKGYGAEIIYCESTQKAREESLAEVVERTDAVFIHPYNDYRVIAGQATAALELFEEVPDLDMLIAPVGGGGLLSGTALTATALDPTVVVFGAEPAGADDAFRSMQAGKVIPMEKPDTIADGLRTSLGSLTFPIIQQYVKEIITVSDSKTIEAMRLVWQRMKIIIEPSSAVALAAVIGNQQLTEGKKVGLIISGGNVDLDNLPWIN